MDFVAMFYISCRREDKTRNPFNAKFVGVGLQYSQSFGFDSDHCN